MARDNRPPQRICGACNGRGSKMVPRVRVKNGKSVTEHVYEPCKQCGGVGWVNR